MNKRPRDSKNTTYLLSDGKLQPQVPDLEEAVLGALMLEKYALARVYNILVPEAFYVDSHKYIYEAIVSLYNDKHPVDILTVINKLRSNGNLELVGGAYYISQLTNRVASAANLEHHSHLIIEKYLKRRCIELAGRVGTESFDDTTNPFEIIESISSDVIKIQDITRKGGEKSWDQAVDEAVIQIKQAMSNESHVVGIPTGNTILDAVTGGWQNSDLIILAGRPGMGKTARALSFLKEALKNGKKCKFYSFEMSVVQLIVRLISEESGIEMNDIRRGRLSDDSYTKIYDIASDLKKFPIKVNDNGRMTILDVSSECRMLKQTEGLEFVIIDYLQITKGPRNNKMNRNDLIGFITAECKNIAKELNIPVMALAQVGRKSESGSDKRPTLEDLRESGSIEQDADVVAFIFRPSYYTGGDINKEKDETLKQMSQEEYSEYSELILAKHRNGKTTNIKEYFNGSTQKFRPFFKEPETENKPETEILPF